MSMNNTEPTTLQSSVVAALLDTSVSSNSPGTENVASSNTFPMTNVESSPSSTASSSSSSSSTIINETTASNVVTSSITSPISNTYNSDTLNPPNYSSTPYSISSYIDNTITSAKSSSSEQHEITFPSSTDIYSYSSSVPTTTTSTFSTSSLSNSPAHESTSSINSFPMTAPSSSFSSSSSFPTSSSMTTAYSPPIISSSSPSTFTSSAKTITTSTTSSSTSSTFSSIETLSSSPIYTSSTQTSNLLSSTSPFPYSSILTPPSTSTTISSTQSSLDPTFSSFPITSSSDLWKILTSTTNSWSSITPTSHSSYIEQSSISRFSSSTVVPTIDHSPSSSQPSSIIHSSVPSPSYVSSTQSFESIYNTLYSSSSIDPTSSIPISPSSTTTQGIPTSNDLTSKYFTSSSNHWDSDTVKTSDKFSSTSPSTSIIQYSTSHEASSSTTAVFHSSSELYGATNTNSPFSPTNTLTSSASSSISSSIESETTTIIHKSDLPGRSAIEESLSHLAKLSSSTAYSSLGTLLTTESQTSTSSTQIFSSKPYYPSSSISSEIPSLITGSPASKSSLYPTTESKSYSTSVISSSSFKSSSTLSQKSSSSRLSAFSSRISSSSKHTTFKTSRKSSLSSSSWSFSSFSPTTTDSSTFTEPTYLVYPQDYYFTADTTSFLTEIPITTFISNSATFIQPTSIITAPVSVYEKWLNGGGLDNTSNDTTSSKTNSNDKGTIIGSVVGSVGGVFLCGLIVWIVLRKTRKHPNRSIKDDKDYNNFLDYGTGYQSTGYQSTGNINNKEITENFNDTLPNSIDFNTNTNINPHGNNPSRQESNPDLRLPPKLPPPRKISIPNPNSRNVSTANQNLGPATNNNDDYHLRFSYLSTETGTSIGTSISGDCSSLSSSPLGFGEPRNINSVDRQGFLSELF